MSAPAYAHEFWIAPLKYQVSVGENVDAHFIVGQDFNGAKSAYVPRRTTQSLTVQKGFVAKYNGTVGDRPAMQVERPQSGLLIIAHETRDDTLTYREWEKFVSFVEHKDFQGALERHAARGLPQTGFTETYRRYGKSLIAVGDGAGSDKRLGLDVEIVALTNPYTSNESTVDVQVWQGDTALTDVQVEVFAKSPSGDVNVTLLRTNGNGVASVSVKAGYEYQIDHVVLEERDPANGAAWHSLWANLTFAVPG
ncbi:MAG: DUF4198 domain-containing protein [Planktomarina sp.]